jgi:ATP-dependent Clp protease ATP-binding subunit ClpX
MKLFELEGISLRFTDEALLAAAKKAMQRKSGARGLRSVMENAMLDVMYELPSDEQAAECVISEEVISEGKYPEVIRSDERRKAV